MDSTQWETLCNDIKNIYNIVKDNRDGEIASYIPQLSKINDDLFGISIYSIDGKYYNIGNTNEKFCIQSCSKPLTYAIALRDNGIDKVNLHIGREPSGARFNAFVFDDENKPYNPLINSGAIMAASLIKNTASDDERFEYIIDTWKSIVGNDNVGFDNAVYLSEKNSAHRNHALAHIMMENNIFPDNTDITNTLEFYFQLCSITMNATSLAKFGAMLAKGGITIDNTKIFDNNIVRDLLCIMYSSGLYDYSGRWSFDIGLPAKSGVSGSIFAVIPNIGGICVYSPKLDKIGNSVRGVDFFYRLTQQYKIHIFDTLITNNDNKKTLFKDNDKLLSQIYTACANKDSNNLLHILRNNNINLNIGDYDNRYPIHIAMDENNYYSVYILLQYGANSKTTDRWENSMYNEIVKNKNTKIASISILYRYIKYIKLKYFKKLCA